MKVRAGDVAGGPGFRHLLPRRHHLSLLDTELAAVAVKGGQAPGVADLKMSDYGIRKDECMALAINARETMGGLFLANPCPMSDEECAGVFARAYR